MIKLLIFLFSFILLSNQIYGQDKSDSVIILENGSEVVASKINEFSVLTDQSLMLVYNKWEKLKIARVSIDGKQIQTFDRLNDSLNHFQYGNGSFHITTIENYKDSIFYLGGSYHNSIQKINMLVKLYLDETFEIYDNIVTSPKNYYTTISDIDIQNDGKILLAGCFIKCKNHECNGIVRLNLDLSYDNTFVSSIKFTRAGLINLIAIDKDQRIIATALNNSIKYYNPNESHGIIRLNTDGTVDSTFNIGYGTHWDINDLILEDYRILLAGSSFEIKGQKIFGIASLNTNGSLKETFEIIKFPSSNVNTISFNDKNELICFFTDTEKNFFLIFDNNGKLKHKIETDLVVQKIVFIPRVGYLVQNSQGVIYRLNIDLKWFE